jgi:hypothetical protein
MKYTNLMDEVLSLRDIILSMSTAEFASHVGPSVLVFSYTNTYELCELFRLQIR